MDRELLEGLLATRPGLRGGLLKEPLDIFQNAAFGLGRKSIKSID
jgi:hypothetical protein